MRLALLITLAVCLSTGLGLAAKPVGPASGAALHFRLEIGVEPGHFVSGWLDESEGTGTGYDTAVLDLDGDGAPDEFLSFPMVTRGTRTYRDVKIRIRHEEADWSFEPYSVGYRRPEAEKGVATIYLRWAVTAGERYCWFINGRGNLYADAAAARRAAPIRLGPPFRFEIGTTTRGRSPLVRVGLKDSQGSTLRLSRSSGEEVRPRVRLLTAEEVHLDTYARYG
jgi:hypothetical protein